MNCVKININTRTEGYAQLNIFDLREENNELVMRVEKNMFFKIQENDTITFKRIISRENKTDRYLIDQVTVKRKGENQQIFATLPRQWRTYLVNKTYESVSIDNKNYYIVECVDDHYLFAQDLSMGVGQELYLKTYDEDALNRASTTNGQTPTNNIVNESKISAMNVYTNGFATIEDCIIDEEHMKTCGQNYDSIKKYGYIFLPQSISRKRFLVLKNSWPTNNTYTYFETKYNPFYYYITYKDEHNKEYEFDNYGNPIRHCYFYGDPWWASIKDLDYDTEYVNLGVDLNGAFVDLNYYSTQININSDSDESTLGSEDYFNKDFAAEIENSLIPPVIDMERIKYVPYREIAENIYIPLDSIKIHPHFRVRVVVDESNNTNTLSTSGNLYYDGWYIDPKNEPNVYWNGFEHVEENDIGNEIETFVSLSGKTSDLLGYLNFTDKDVYYKKNKLKKSFFRLSFYTSKDPIEQKLLCYSTLFVDSTELLSKYLKQSMFIDSSPDDLDIDAFCSGNPNVQVVFCKNEDVNSKLDTTITITNEYNTERSAEGYNLYLFSDDAPEINTVKTIYMKVEFNHAGVGKTIPMIVMPPLGDLNVNNFFDYLYIPIDILRYEEKYIYIIKTGEYIGNDLHLCLFEPKLKINIE